MKYFDMEIAFTWHGEAIAQIPDGMIRGRNIKEGYSRGCALQFSNLSESLNRDPYLLAAVKLARSRNTPLDDAKLANFWLLIKYHLQHLPGRTIVEFGTARGGSALFIALLAQRFRPDLTVLCFDTFAGMPAVDPDHDAMLAGDFADIDFDGLVATANRLGLDNLRFVKGLLQETAPDWLPRCGPVALAHIDVDIYDSVSAAYEIVKPHMVGGGYLVFDDPLISSCLGAFEAVEELLIRRDGLHAEQVFPHLVFRAP